MLQFRMKPNPYVHPEFQKIAEITLRFEDCARYRITPVNDQGWHLGQCRFSRLAPARGEFYEISGDTRDSLDAMSRIGMEGSGMRHFHFYLRDETIEAKALDWSMTPSLGRR